jgi:hypothetical protein
VKFSRPKADTETALQLPDFNSLMRPVNSLFRELFSVIIRVGKYSKSGCGTAVFGADIFAQPQKLGTSL